MLFFVVILWESSGVTSGVHLMVLSFEDLFPPQTKRWKSVFTVKWFEIKTYCMYDTDSKVSILLVWKLYIYFYSVSLC